MKGRNVAKVQSTEWLMFELEKKTNTETQQWTWSYASDEQGFSVFSKIVQNTDTLSGGYSNQIVQSSRSKCQISVFCMIRKLCMIIKYMDLSC